MEQRQASIPPKGFSGAAPAAEDEAGLSAGQLFSALLRRKWLILASVVLGIVAGYVAFGFQAPSYTVQALVQVGERDQRSVGVTAIEVGQRLSPISWAGLVRSNRVLERVVDDLNLFVSARPPTPPDAFLDARVIGPIRAGGYTITVDESGGVVQLMTADERVMETHSIEELRESFAEADSGESGDPAVLGHSVGVSLNLSPDLLEPGAEMPFFLQPRRDAAMGLSQGLRVETGMSAFMSVGMSGSNPYWLALIVNSVVENFVAEATDLARAQSEGLSGTLEEQLRSAVSELQAAEAALENFETQTISRPDLTARGAGGGGAETELLELRLELDRLTRDRERIQSVLVRTEQDGTLGVQALEAIPTVRESSELLAALEEVTERRAELRSILVRYTPEHPAAREVRRELDELEQTAIPAIARELVSELDGRIGDLSARASNRSSELESIPAQALTRARLQRQLEQAEALYGDVNRRYSSARLAAISTTPDIQIVDLAEAPLRPDGDRRLLFAAAAFFGFLGVGGLGAILLDRRDPTVRSPQDVEARMGLAILGAAPHLKLRRGRIDPQDQHQAVEAFRSIRLALLYAFGSSGPFVSTVSSAAPGDGKSFVTSNLAISFAELGRRTVIVDGDVRRGTQHTLFGLDNSLGLADFLGSSAGYEDILQETHHPSLSVITRGTPLRNAPEAMVTGRMQDLLASLKEEFDVILVDSPPFGAASDPLILGALTGNLVMVLRNGATDTGQAEAVLQQLRRYPIRVLGAVLNDVPQGGSYRHYTFYEGYGIDEETPKRTSKDRKLVSTGT